MELMTRMQRQVAAIAVNLPAGNQQRMIENLKELGLIKQPNFNLAYGPTSMSSATNRS